MEGELDFDLAQDEQGRSVMVLICPECERQNRHLFTSLTANTEVRCRGCDGVHWSFTNGQLAELGSALDDLGGDFDIKL